MRSSSAILINEKGSVIILAMMILVILTLLGIAGTHTSMTEVQISSNQRFHKMAFAAAESGWQVAVNWLDTREPLVTVDCGMDTTGGGVALSAGKFAAPDHISVGGVNYYTATSEFGGVQFVPGYSTEFMRHIYAVSSTGTGPREAQSRLEITAGKIGYVGGY
ncbi:MAG: hypothetical protein JSW39_01150 [Desulfobacterales bacterium]|nr:MAG: hypothetical protein JSW39_01150 [Desulfobacterales bacterium]